MVKDYPSWVWQEVKEEGREAQCLECSCTDVAVRSQRQTVGRLRPSDYPCPSADMLLFLFHLSRHQPSPSAPLSRLLAHLWNRKANLEFLFLKHYFTQHFQTTLKNQPWPFRNQCSSRREKPKAHLSTPPPQCPVNSVIMFPKACSLDTGSKEYTAWKRVLGPKDLINWGTTYTQPFKKTHNTN